MYGQPYYNPYLSTFSRADSVQFVNGIESAQAYPLMPNSQQILMDKNESRFYWVSSDAAGMKSIRAYDFSPVQEKPTPEYVTREEFDRWRQSYESSIPAEPEYTDVCEAPAVYEVNKPKFRSRST